MIAARRTDGYSRISIAAHWFAALLVVALFFTHEGERGSTEHMLHVSGGAIAGLFLLWRVWHRLYSGMTEKPDQAALLNLASRIVIWGFLAAIVVVVISGYLLPWSLGRPLDLFGLASIPSPMAASRGLHEFMEELHEVSGHLFLPLLALHISGAAKHAFIDRDGIVKRMFKPVVGGK